MTDEGGPRRTRLYGAVDLPDPTIDETGALPAQPGLSPGEYLEHYRIEGVLGRGGMGEVLSAKDEQIGRSVAIKRLRVANPSAHVLDRFLREVRIQSRLEHPAIVPVYGLYADVEQPFFVMKQLAGTTLAEVIERLARGDVADAKQFSRQHLLRAFVDVCLALELAHARGVIHRDIKPANVLVEGAASDPLAKRKALLMDFGVARLADDPRAPDASLVGSLPYIAPEQIQNADAIDARADVYSLGATAYELVTGRPPFVDDNALGLVLAHLNQPPADPRTFAPELPESAAKAILRALAKEPADRYATAPAFADALAR